MKRKYIYIILFAIVLLAAGLRLWQLGHVPPSPDWDEVALGYDAYSIIHTGRDEYGKFLPVVLRSFDDYKPALYAYLIIPSVLLFGLDLFAVRLPSAVFGVISVIAVFYLIRELFERYKYRDHLALLTSFLLAISPWSIQFSRVGFEANVGDALNILAALFFLKGLKKPWILFLSAFFAGASIYVYQSEKVFTPLLVLALVVIYRKKLFSVSWIKLLEVVIFGLLVVMPMVLYITTNKRALLRVKGTIVFSQETVLLQNDIQKLVRDKKNNDLIGKIFDNRRIVYVKTVLGGYLVHYDPNWLFITGDNSRHHAPNMGILYIFEFPFILIGIYMLIFGEFDRKTKVAIFAWFLLAPVPASVTTGVPHAVRTLNFLPTWQIFSAIGIITAFQKISNVKLKILNFKLWKLFVICYLLFVLLNISYYLDQYFVQLNYYTSADWQYGYKQAVSEVKKIGRNYKQIVVSDRSPLDKSYMFFLFYLKYPPAKYQVIGRYSSGGYASHHYFGKYVFHPIDWQKDSQKKDVLYIGTPAEIPASANLIETIYNLDGTPAIRIAGT